MGTKSSSFPKADNDTESANPRETIILPILSPFNDIHYFKRCFSTIIPASESLWVYACFIALNHQIFHAFKMSTEVCVPFPPIPTTEPFVGSATVVLNKILYVIGGINPTQKKARNDVYVFNPNYSRWDIAPPTIAKRNYAVAAVGSNKKLFVFGGLEEAEEEERKIPWAEIYDPEEHKWTAILGRPYGRPTNSPLLKALAVGDKIFIQARDDAFLFDVNSSSWLPLPQELRKYWFFRFPAAAVGNMLISSQIEHKGPGSGPPKIQLRIQAYDTQRNQWFNGGLIHWLDQSPSFDLMSADGKLVLYGMEDERNGGMRFIAYDIQEIDESRVEANLSWEGIYIGMKEHWSLATPAHAASATGQ